MRWEKKIEHEGHEGHGGWNGTITAGLAGRVYPHYLS
jgi:hypothetical protein